MARSDVDRIETRRLRAERLQPRHFLSLLSMHQDPRTMQTLGGLRGHEETRLYLRQNLDHWRRWGHGIWILRERRSGRTLGRAGIRFGELEGDGRAALSYALSSEVWGEGLGTEIARALVQVAQRDLGLAEIIAAAYPHNVASRRVMEKAGLTFEREVMHAGERHVLYSLRFEPPFSGKREGS